MFDFVGKDEKDLMNATKNIKNRMRLRREIDYSEDFRRRFLTKEYGNYDKFEKNNITKETEEKTMDTGDLEYWKRHYAGMMAKMSIGPDHDARKNENNRFEQLLDPEITKKEGW
jgi:hypothetical protein